LAANDKFNDIGVDVLKAPMGTAPKSGGKRTTMSDFMAFMIKHAAASKELEKELATLKAEAVALGIATP
jgi:hypothetical protein